MTIRCICSDISSIESIGGGVGRGNGIKKLTMSVMGRCGCGYFDKFGQVQNNPNIEEVFVYDGELLPHKLVPNPGKKVMECASENIQEVKNEITWSLHDTTVSKSLGENNRSVDTWLKGRFKCRAYGDDEHDNFKVNDIFIMGQGRD